MIHLSRGPLVALGIRAYTEKVTRVPAFNASSLCLGGKNPAISRGSKQGEVDFDSLPSQKGKKQSEHLTLTSLGNIVES